jgi:hypothetical protein
VTACVRNLVTHIRVVPTSVPEVSSVITASRVVAAACAMSLGHVGLTSSRSLAGLLLAKYVT